MAVAGPVTCTLSVTTTAASMDWAVKLVDVYPDGAGYNIAEGILKSTTANGLVMIDMLGTANVFLPGHSIRLDVTSAVSIVHTCCASVHHPNQSTFVISLLDRPASSVKGGRSDTSELSGLVVICVPGPGCLSAGLPGCRAAWLPSCAEELPDVCARRGSRRQRRALGRINDHASSRGLSWPTAFRCAAEHLRYVNCAQPVHGGVALCGSPLPPGVQE